MTRTRVSVLAAMLTGVVVVGVLVALAATRPATVSSTWPRVEPLPDAERPSAQPTAPGGTLTPCPQGSRLTAMTFNIHFGKTARGEPGLDRIAREIRAWAPDVVVLNEVDRGRGRSGGVAQARVLGQRTGMHAAYGPNRRYGGGWSGNAVLSRLPVVRSGNRALPFVEGTIPRGLLRVTVDLDGVPVDVFATHFENSSPAARRRQAREVARTVSRSPRPFVLGGDLNASPGGVALQVLDRAGVVDAWTQVGRGDGFTVPAWAPRKRIDYLLSDERLLPRRSEVLLSQVSDHRPVRTVFDVAASC
ncbi:endonuclease/exonuclease/phosphatase family protein [Nocardioides aestuarii]|uniref:Endonuclease/exonuclease/phosphatase family protein n=1 Tax=Nocardioides aestuarii TaxID=252231 RepID=A0ABW4TIR1_9ACTN